MATQIVYECKCCGGDIEEVSKGIGKCTSCRRTQSMPVSTDIELINRANRIRKKAIFDEAKDLYTRIVSENPDEPEAYWGIVLCRYGIEYVDDYDGEAIPTCHRTIESSIKEDPDFITACEKAGAELRAYYESQADKIDDIQKKILTIVKKDKPYDVFISYKSHDADGNPTVDSKYAQKIFNLLERKGLKVFFAEETLKKYAGTEYEPHIYAALKSSKVMVLIGGCEEYLEAPWVKNEWRRYQDMIKNGDEKRLLVVYFDMEPYDMPQELVKLQAIDWKTADAQNTLVANIENALGFDSESGGGNVGISDKQMRAAMKSNAKEKAAVKLNNAKALLASGNKKNAMDLLDEVIKEAPSYSAAYWTRLLANMGQTEETIYDVNYDYSIEPDYVSAYQTGSPEEKKFYDSVLAECQKNIDVQNAYLNSHSIMVKQFADYANESEAVTKFRDMKQSLESKLLLKPYNVYKGYFTQIILLIVGFLVCASFLPYALHENSDTFNTVGLVLVIGGFIVGAFFTGALSGSIVAAIVVGLLISVVIGMALDALEKALTVKLAWQIFGGAAVFLIIVIVFTVLKIKKNLAKRACRAECNNLMVQMSETITVLKEEFGEAEKQLNNQYLAKRARPSSMLTLNRDSRYYAQLDNLYTDYIVQIEKQQGEFLTDEELKEAKADGTIGFNPDTVKDGKVKKKKKDKDKAKNEPVKKDAQP